MGRLSLTEADLWKALRGPGWTRIESSTIDGISDIEYVSERAHGWIETKVAPCPRDAIKPYRLGHELTVHQAAWLLHHHRPKINLISYLLVGIYSARKFDYFLLLPPSVAVAAFVSGRAPIPSKILRTARGVLQFDSASDVRRFVMNNKGVL